MSETHVNGTASCSTRTFIDCNRDYYEDNLEHMRPKCTRVPVEESFTSSSALTLLSPPASKTISVSEKFVSKRRILRELLNQTVKQRRHTVNQSVSHWTKIVPPVTVSACKKDNKNVKRLTSHCFRPIQYVPEDSMDRICKEFSIEFIKTLLTTLGGFLITITYRGIVVILSPNVHEYLGYTELELLGQNIYNYVHEGDHALLRDQLMPPTSMLGPNGALLAPRNYADTVKIAEALANQKRSFMIRFKIRNRYNSGPIKYVTFNMEGVLQKADKACPQYYQIIRRSRSRGRHSTCGNDVILIGVARPIKETLMTEGVVESSIMEYRNSLNGKIVQCEQRTALVKGYITHEFSGANAMNYNMQHDDARLALVDLHESNFAQVIESNFEPQAGPSGLCGLKRRHAAEDGEPRTYNLLDEFDLQPEDELEFVNWDMYGINYSDELEISRFYKHSYFANIEE